MPKTPPRQDSPEPPHGRVAHVAEVARDGVQDAAHRTAQAIEGNPLSVLVGGLALGAVAAALIPKSRREMRLLAPVGRQITDRGREALETAKETGREQLGLAGISRDNAKSQGNALLENLLQALAQAGSAAITQASARRPAA